MSDLSQLVLPPKQEAGRIQWGAVLGAAAGVAVLNIMILFISGYFILRQELGFLPVFESPAFGLDAMRLYLDSVHYALTIPRVVIGLVIVFMAEIAIGLLLVAVRKQSLAAGVATGAIVGAAFALLM
jgi:hypothetical protein